MKNENKNSTSNAEMVTITRAEYEKFTAQEEHIAELEAKLECLMEALRLARQKRFGASSEKADEDVMEQLSLLFNEAEAFSTEEKEAETVTVPEHTRRKHKEHEYTLDKLPEDIPVEVIEHELHGEELACPQCGEEMQDIGVEEVRKLKIKPAEFVVELHRYHSYACRDCEKETVETPVVKAPRDKGVIPGSFATPETIAYIMTQKFVMGSPIYRLEKEMKLRGIPLSRQTMSNWTLKATSDYLSPVWNRLHVLIVLRDVLHSDDTTVQVLHEPGRAPQTKSYMWLYRTSGDTDKPIVLYEYQSGRGRQYPEAFLKGFKGYLHTDGYEVYHGLSDEITVVGCWAHARRLFEEAMKSLPKGKAKGSAAAQGAAYCSMLFKIEDGLAELSPEERYKARQEQSKPVLDAFWSWANTREAGKSTALGKALGYLKGQWPYLTNYLLDGRLEISNNRAERSIKPFVIDRKNFLFANTPKGAEGSAIMFSIIQTALENGLDPYRYLTWLMKEAANADMEDEAVLDRLLPWNAPEEYRLK